MPCSNLQLTRFAKLKSQKMNKILIILLVVVGLAACQQGKRIEIPVTQLKRGTFTEVLTEEGSVRAIKNTVITTPKISYRYGSMKISTIVEDGTEVEKGDTLIVFNPAELKKSIIDAEQQLEIASAEYEKQKAMQESAVEDLKSDLEITELSYQISEIKYSNAEYESEITKREIKLQLETAKISLNRAREQIENKKKINVEELFQKRLNMKQLRIKLQEAQESIDNLFVVSPSNGIAIVRDNYMTRQKWRAGDQPHAGYPIINLPDLSAMMIDMKINEVEVSKVKPGLPVIIKADAFSDTVYTGTIDYIANLAQPKDRNGKIKVFPITVLVDGTETNLLPGLTVSCTIKTSEIPDVLYLPVECIFEETGLTFVYVKSGSSFQRQNVIISERNTDYAIIVDGLSEGQDVALADPFLNKQEDK